MPSTMYWIGATGAQSWSNTANWSGGAVPGTGDTVFILNGSSDISSGLAQSAVTLAALTVGSQFTGTVGVAGDAGAYLDIGITAFSAIAASSPTGLLSGGFTRFKWNPAAVAFTAVVQATGSSADSGRGALQIKGGTAASKLYVIAGSVDVATKPGETGTLLELDVSGGTVSTGSGLTCPTITQSGNSSVLTIRHAVTTLTQRSGTLYTFGTGLLGTTKINGTAYLNHRVSGDSFTTFTVDSRGVADFTGDPRTVLFTNTPTLNEGATIRAFNTAQLKLTGPADFKFKCEDCELAEVLIDIGDDYTVTIT